MRIELDLTENREPHQRCKHLRLPIKSIDGIKVQVQITMYKPKNEMELDIYTDLITHAIYTKKMDFTKETSKDDTMKLLDTIKSLKFCKYITKFVDNCQKEENYMTASSWQDLFKDCETIVLKWNSCCVCHELTNTQFTDCHHNICLECVGKLKLEEDDYVRCPYCRELHELSEDTIKEEFISSVGMSVKLP